MNPVGHKIIQCGPRAGGWPLLVYNMYCILQAKSQGTPLLTLTPHNEYSCHKPASLIYIYLYTSTSGLAMNAWLIVIMVASLSPLNGVYGARVVLEFGEFNKKTVSVRNTINAPHSTENPRWRKSIFIQQGKTNLAKNCLIFLCSKWIEFYDYDE